MSKIYNKVIIVDENDNVIGAENLLVAIKKKRICRSSIVYVFNQSGQLLVQRRSKNVFKPLLLDQSAAGHVDEGETYIAAAERELYEELGIKDLKLEEIMLSLRTANHFSGAYKVIIPDTFQINFNTKEVDSVTWFNLSNLESEMENNPAEFSPTFLEAWLKLRDKLIS
jgi:isopentenyl-diphosphate delta-isomerase